MREIGHRIFGCLLASGLAITFFTIVISAMEAFLSESMIEDFKSSVFSDVAISVASIVTIFFAVFGWTYTDRKRNSVDSNQQPTEMNPEFSRYYRPVVSAVVVAFLIVGLIFYIRVSDDPRLEIADVRQDLEPHLISAAFGQVLGEEVKNWSEDAENSMKFTPDEPSSYFGDYSVSFTKIEKSVFAVTATEHYPDIASCRESMSEVEYILDRKYISIKNDVDKTEKTEAAIVYSERERYINLSCQSFGAIRMVLAYHDRTIAERSTVEAMRSALSEVSKKRNDALKTNTDGF